MVAVNMYFAYAGFGLFVSEIENGLKISSPLLLVNDVCITLLMLSTILDLLLPDFPAVSMRRAMLFPTIAILGL